MRAAGAHAAHAQTQAKAEDLSGIGRSEQMKDNSEKMYDGVTDIRDDLVENAKTQNISHPK